jgi:hypothetical protein
VVLYEHNAENQTEAGEESAIPWLGLRDGPRDRYREQSTRLEDRLNEARNWFKDCKANHPSCVPRKDGWPRRVLDLSKDSIRLINSASIESTSLQPQEGYACLSYAWGTDGNLKTLTDNIQSHMQGIDISTLPRTLIDAVHVSRAFDLRYLWVKIQTSKISRAGTDSYTRSMRYASYKMMYKTGWTRSHACHLYTKEPNS